MRPEARQEADETTDFDEGEPREEPESPAEDLPPEPAPAPRPQRREDFKPAEPAAVTDVISVVNGIITSLRQSLDQMEEILETLELAEVQKTADEREIQSLRNALRGFERRGEPSGERRPHDSRRPRR